MMLLPEAALASGGPSGPHLAAPPFMRAMALLLGIGTVDLIATAVLSTGGRIEERNPLMAGLLAHGPWPFVAAKAATLVLAGLLLARQDGHAVRRACLAGSAAYLALLALAFWG